ncbi:hypothetical protein [Ferrimicrobium acidiphilum]|jgi:hypothetical protein|uniref:hypothetical protein n=1 Tax=Ferrimicrobium acidiphilum TaxID=121039 RepID=UPI0023F2EF41|nr:hypothetical protein [Ferrimicrobium acidiphilum]
MYRHSLRDVLIILAHSLCDEDVIGLGAACCLVDILAFRQLGYRITDEAYIKTEYEVMPAGMSGALQELIRDGVAIVYADSGGRSHLRVSVNPLEEYAFSKRELNLIQVVVAMTRDGGVARISSLIQATNGWQETRIYCAIPGSRLVDFVALPADKTPGH